MDEAIPNSKGEGGGASGPRSDAGKKGAAAKAAKRQLIKDDDQCVYLQEQEEG